MKLHLMLKQLEKEAEEDEEIYDARLLAVDFETFSFLGYPSYPYTPIHPPPAIRNAHFGARVSDFMCLLLASETLGQFLKHAALSFS
jgi:hypothetical protein